MTILVVGDGNFSFSQALAQLLRKRNGSIASLVATSFDSDDSIKVRELTIKILNVTCWNLRIIAMWSFHLDGKLEELVSTLSSMTAAAPAAVGIVFETTKMQSDYQIVWMNFKFNCHRSNIPKRRDTSLKSSSAVERSFMMWTRQHSIQTCRQLLMPHFSTSYFIIHI